MAERIKDNKINVSIRALVASFLIALFLLFLYGILMSVSNKVLFDTVWDGNYSIMTLVMASSTFVFFSKLTYEKEKINYALAIIGSNTLGIYLIHRFVGAITLPYFRNLTLSNSLVLNILYGLFLLLSSLLIVFIVKKFPLLRKTVNI